jgi:hypothetical protein
MILCWKKPLDLNSRSDFEIPYSWKIHTGCIPLNKSGNGAALYGSFGAGRWLVPFGLGSNGLNDKMEWCGFGEKTGWSSVVRLDANDRQMGRAHGLNPWFAVHSLLTPRSRQCGVLVEAESQRLVQAMHNHGVIRSIFFVWCGAAVA